MLVSKREFTEIIIRGINDRLEKLGRTRNQLAEDMHRARVLHRDTVHKVLSGRVRPRPMTLAALMRELDMTAQRHRHGGWTLEFCASMASYRAMLDKWRSLQV